MLEIFVCFFKAMKERSGQMFVSGSEVLEPLAFITRQNSKVVKVKLSFIDSLICNRKVSFRFLPCKSIH